MRIVDGHKLHWRVKDYSGERIGRLTVKRLIGRKEDRSRKPWLWECECDCGNIIEACSPELSTQDTKSCGCLNAELASERNRKHGYIGTREYLAWKGIKQRVFNKNNKDYEVYSKVGMSDSFANDFTAFLEDIGKIPEGMEGRVSVDRIDNTKGYVEGNVRWATDVEQARNKGRYANNKSGVTGVYNKQGKRWVATWYSSPKNQKHKSFSINKYGDELAFLMVCEYRQHQIDLLNLMGAGYTENHGK